MTPSNLQILAYEDTPLGPLCLRRRELLSSPGTVVTEVTLDHAFLMSSYNTDSERALSTLAIEMHGGDRLRVLIGGLGLGYTADAALASPSVAGVEAVEFLPDVVDWLEGDLVPLSGSLKSDPRFTAVLGDIYARLAEPPAEVHDIVVIDVDHAPDDRLGEANRHFYTEEGLNQARQHLAPGGVLGVWSYSESAPFEATLRKVFSEVRVESVTFWNDMVDEENTDWLFFAR